LGLKRATWLTFRRTYSSWAHDKGVPGKVIAQIMGHAKVDTTLNIYTQVLDGSLRTAADHVNRRKINTLRGFAGLDGEVPNRGSQIGKPDAIDVHDVASVDHPKPGLGVSRGQEKVKVSSG
jgi:hypothetical protein